MRTHEPATQDVERHPSLDERFDPAIRIVAYDAGWPAAAAAELRRVAGVLGCLAVRLEHVGSTSVPGLGAKPILDLQASVSAIEPRSAYARPLEGLGYLFVPDPDYPDFHLFTRPAQRPRSHHLHVCAAGGRDEFRHLAVRDFLRAHPSAAGEYESLKRALARRHPQDRLAYMAGKRAYVCELEARAVRWAHSVGLAQAP